MNKTRDEIRREIRDLELKRVKGAEEFDEREAEINDLLDQLVSTRAQSVEEKAN